MGRYEVILSEWTQTSVKEIVTVREIGPEGQRSAKMLRLPVTVLKAAQ